MYTSVNAGVIIDTDNGAAMVERVDILTERERQIAALVAAGKPNKAIAADLGISRHTVNAHLVAIFRALGVAKRQQVAEWYAVATMGEVGDAQ